MSLLPAATRASERRVAPSPFSLSLPFRLDVAAWLRKLANFWLVWTALLIVHEGGHALVARHERLSLERVTVGVGPVLWRAHPNDVDLVIRLVPVLGVTSVAELDATHSLAHDPAGRSGWSAWAPQLATIGGGIVATLALASLAAGMVALRERVARRRWIWGRMLIADAIVLTVFNFLPVPPLDGGRAALQVVAWRGVPFAPDTLFWVHAGGLALAVVPLALWTRWTARIDRFVMRWRAPSER
jgi:membrane-associated protease RseP (regulator of RpoE activity)